MRLKIEMWYTRQAGKHVYDVDLDLLEEGLENAFEQVFELEFKGIDLQDAGVRLHHLIRLVEGRGEIAVFCIQKDHRMSCSPNEINVLRESEASAKRFFAPTVIERR